MKDIIKKEKLSIEGDIIDMLYQSVSRVTNIPPAKTSLGLFRVVITPSLAYLLSHIT
jgi:hypothetical protein